tara:strand:- start:494 stop:718 length:225 start_codon:yes stop_codon:yes gene_type:complete
MPRNYSVKQTIAMIKSGIKQQAAAEEEIIKEEIIKEKVVNAKPVKLETTKKNDIIKFHRPDEKPTKKWYQFWKK